MSSPWTRRSVRWFFLVGFGLPWLGWTLRALTGATGPVATMMFYTGDFMAVAGFVATYVASGRPGLRSLFGRFVQIRAPVLWILFALLLPFVWVAATTIAYGLSHGGIGRIVPAGLLGFFTTSTLVAATTGPLGEEAGWRGFFLPRLLGRYSPIVASLILGVIWAAWHYPLYYNRVFATVGGAAGFTVSCLCFSILLTVLWAYTGGSVFWAMVLHWSINVTPGVVGDVFPHVTIPDGANDLLRVGFLVAATVITVGLIGPGRLKAKLDEVRAGLTVEAVDADRA